jgi:hypothetical protein
MKVLKAGLLVVVLLALGMMAGCNEGNARKNNMMGNDSVEWRQGLTGFPHPVILHP